MQILFLLLRYDKLVNVTKKQYIIFARVVELVDTLVLGTSANRREGSSPFSCTIKSSQFIWLFFLVKITFTLFREYVKIIAEALFLCWP